MRTHQNPTSFSQSKYPRRNETPFQKTNYKKNNKMPTEEHAPNQQPFLTTNTVSKEFINFYPNILNQVSKSEVFINTIPQVKDLQAEEKKGNASNKYIWGNSNKESFKNSRENPNEVLAKRSVQILIGLNQGMVKAQYSKISRRKQQLIKKNTLSNQMIEVMIPAKMENVSSEQKIIEKYRQLLYHKDKPFNMINKLYQIDLLTAKEATIRPKQISKPISVKLNIMRKASNLQDKINQFSQKSKTNNKVKDMLLCGSQKFISKQTEQSATSTNFHQNKKPYSQESYKQARPLRQIRSKNLKIAQQPANNKKIDSPIKGNELKLNQYTYKKSEIVSSSLESPTKIQKQVSLPLPNKISSSAFIIYEVFQEKVKSYSKKIQFQTVKKRQMIGKIHASLNIKSASQIASLTKIMTCIVIIQLCQKFTINPYEQKYKTGIFQSVIKGTTAEIQAGQIYSIHQLLHGLMLPSGNDASLALARWGGNILLLTDAQGQKRRAQQKSEKTLLTEHWLVNNKYLRYKEDKIRYKRCYNRFIAEMNKKARILGLERTTYVNSHGLSNPHNKSCCLDLAILCQYVMQYSYFRSIVGCKQYNGCIQKCVQVAVSPRKKKGKSVKAKISDDPEQMNLLYDAEDEGEFNKSDEQDQDQTQADLTVSWNKKANSQDDKNQITYIPKQIKWVNTHRLMQKKEEYVGIKTGVTTTAGACLASYVNIKARSFIIIVLNSKKLSMRFTDTQLLRRWLIKKENLSYSVTNLDYYSQVNLLQ